MKQLTALVLMAMMVTLIVPGLVQAQRLIAVGGIIQAADCQTNTLTLKTADGSARVVVTTTATVLYINSTAADLCSLSGYAGAVATVWITPADDRLVAGRVDVSTAAAPIVAQPAPSYGYGPYGSAPYYGPYFDPYYDPYLNYDPFYYGTYLHPYF